ncbi:MAG: DUF2309 domain-containing protein [Enhygromyxa sp.]
MVTPEADSRLAAVIEELAHLLPAQGPITVFIHHNTLHAFERLRFEEAVVRAGELLGCEPFASEEFYRVELDRGRITATDVELTLARTLGAGGDETIVGGLSRYELRRRVALYGIPQARRAAIDWLRDGALERMRDDLPVDVREAIAGIRGESGPGGASEREALASLWAACRAAVERSSAEPRELAPPSTLRHRDAILRDCGIDIDEWVHPLLIRFVSAYLDQGLAQWPMVGRERGLLACFLDTFDSSLAGLCGVWARALPRVIADLRARQVSALESIAASLRALGVGEDEHREFLAATALALRGFAGMVRQLEERPDRVPVYPIPATLAEFLAVRLLLERVAIEHVAATRLRAPVTDLRRRSQAPPGPSLSERTWPLFQVAQLCGFWAADVAGFEPNQLAALERELLEFDGLACRELLHLAYERHIRQRFYDAVAQHRPTPTPEQPRFQAVFCIDEREESFRRHLEELAPEAETFGAAGFYGVAMYYRGAGDAHPRPLAPANLQPHHYVAEAGQQRRGAWGRIRRFRRRSAGVVDKILLRGSQTLVRGAIVMTALGALSILPLLGRVLFPRLRPKAARLELPGTAAEPTRLLVERSPGVPPIGRFIGFELDERVAIVAEQLDNLGVADRLAPLVLVIGHGSISLNNPHESAHDCGACGGGHGGPNARALAQMANDPQVRAALRERGVVIPDGTWFVGGERNTCDNSLTWFDTDTIPAALRAEFEHTQARFEAARRREAHERCRRFEHAGLRWSSRAALRHVEARAADLAQPRPEYGHASNAVCFVGRRERVRGLFLDRRAFLVSYDPRRDPEAEILARLLAAAVPVIAGISLEYYFSFIDPTGYGAGTKLPHNVTALLGVMDGAQSDLRTGLPWQMVEIHEPVRISIVVESPPERLVRILADNPSLAALFEKRWLYLACLDPDGDQLCEWGPEGFEICAPEHPLPVARGSSRSVYQGKRGHLPFTRVIPDPPTRRAAGGPEDRPRPRSRA